MKAKPTHLNSTVLTCALWLSLFLCLSGLMQTQAQVQVTTLQDWTSLYNGTASPGNLTYNVQAGSNTYRLMVVAIASSGTSQDTRTFSVTYGGQALTLVDGDQATSLYTNTSLYYLNEAGLDAATTSTLNVTVTGTTRINTVFTAVFDLVDQTNPITNSRNYNSTSTQTTFAYSPALSVNAYNLAFGIVNSDRTSSTTLRTVSSYPANWSLSTEQIYTSTSGTDIAARHMILSRTIPTTNITDAASITMSGVSYPSMTALSLNPATTSGYYTLNGTYTVPSGVTCITVKAWGAGGGGGGGGSNRTGGNGGGGAYAESTINVTPGNQLTIRVGGAGNGGTAGTVGNAGSGGGYSGVFNGTPSQANAIVVAGAGAGGGGGDNETGGTPNGGAGGAGGANTGAAGGGGGGSVAGGAGGTLSAGGGAGNGDGTPTAGAALSGGNGGNLSSTTPGGTNGGGTGGGGASGTRPGGGGGGAGYFGGGGGGASNAGTTSGGGGGGGSSFAAGETINTLAASGLNPANASDPHFIGGFATGGSGGAITVNGSPGSGGLVYILVNECPTFTYQKSDATCFGANNGSITINAQGGTPPYQYSINGGTSWQSGNIFNNLSPADYIIVVKDSKGCEQTECE